MSEKNLIGSNVEQCNKLCRTCLSTDKVLRSVFDISLGNITFNIVIAEATGILILNENTSSTEICDECKDKATIAFEFKKKSLECNEYFKGIAGSCFKTEEDEDLVVDSEGEQYSNNKIKSYENLDSNDFDSGANNDFSMLGFNSNLRNVNTLEQSIKCEVSLDPQETFKEHIIEKCVKIEKIEEEYSCIICESYFINEKALSEHMCKDHNKTKIEPKKKEKRKRKTVTISKVKFSKSSQESKFKIIDCGICKEKIESKQHMVEHMADHKEMTIYSCLLCKNMYINKLKAEYHLCSEAKDKESDDKVNENNGDVETQSYDKINFITEICLQSILEAKTPGDEMECLTIIQVCPNCSALFLSKDGLLNHIDKVHPKSSHRCLFCMKMFSSTRSASRHRTICKHLERIYRCPTCHHAFPYESSLNKHIISAHKGQVVSIGFLDKTNGDKKFQCDICNKQYHRQDLLDRHSRCHKPNAKRYECDVCRKSYIRADSLRTHLLTHEPADKLPSEACLCLYCGRRFSNSSNLVVHMRRHTGEKPYKCDFCGKGFPRSTDLLYHRRSHTGEKPCICNVCGKAFTRNNKLSRHMRVHTGDRPYKCTYCDKAFTQSNDLKLHVRRHTGDKPYVCELCGERFIQGTALQSHRRNYGHFPASTDLSTITIISKGKI